MLNLCPSNYAGDLNITGKPFWICIPEFPIPDKKQLCFPCFSDKGTPINYSNLSSLPVPENMFLQELFTILSLSIFYYHSNQYYSIPRDPVQGPVFWLQSSSFKIDCEILTVEVKIG